jgi:hypothetical protein
MLIFILIVELLSFLSAICLAVFWFVYDRGDLEPIIITLTVVPLILEVFADGLKPVQLMIHQV